MKIFLAGFVAGALFAVCALGWLSTMDDEVDENGRPYS